MARGRRITSIDELMCEAALRRAIYVEAWKCRVPAAFMVHLHVADAHRLMRFGGLYLWIREAKRRKA